MKPNDPLFAKQWHFDLIGDIGAIWDDYSGKGVHVGVYDEGVAFANPDLKARHDAGREIVIEGETRSGAPNDKSDFTQEHGTAVAGLIAASADNGTGGVGVSWGASLTSVNIYDTTKPEFINGDDFDTALAALRQMSNFDVANSSWGSFAGFDPDSNLSDPSSAASQENATYAFVAATGRGGLGTVMVRSAGNDSVDAEGDGINASRFTVTVAATLRDGFATIYSNFGPSVLVTAPGGDRSVVTTDRPGKDGYNDGDGFDVSGDYTDTFDGTSAAAPIVSGVVALMLDADAGLGWRDAQTILAASASATGSRLGTGGDWIEFGSWQVNGARNWNGGGAHFHDSYGYGMVNAFNAVRMAEAWHLFSPAAQTSANEQTASTGTLKPGKAIAPNGSVSFDFTLGTKLLVEHVDVTLGIKAFNLKQLGISLVSAAGTETPLRVIVAPADAAVDGATWTFGLDNLRGELSAGKWTLKIEDHHSAEAGRLTSVKLDIFGARPGKADMYHFTDEFSDVAKLDAGRKSIADRNGGEDWIDAAALHSAVRVDLAAGKAVIDGTRVTLAGIDDAVSGDGRDTLVGGDGANTLAGMRGRDTLTGNGGRDTFVFGAPLDAGTNVDAITDFGVGEDRIRLERGVFDALGKAGALAANLFKDLGIDGAKIDGDDRILYDSGTGALSYDADGSGGDGAVLFARIGGKVHAALSAADFLVA